MIQSSPLIRLSAIPLLFFAGACDDAKTPPPAPPTQALTTELDPETLPPPAASGERQVIEELFRATAQEQAEGLGSGQVKVNGAWPYVGYSHLAPDPAAAIEARLVAVDITVTGHTPRFDFDDIEIVDGATLVSYGSDPHITPLRADGALLSDDETIPAAPAPSRWLLIFAFPKASPQFHLYYWGKALTPSPVGFGKSGIALPYPKAE